VRHGGVVLLAAGYSRRFGADKRRHRLADGRALAEASLDLYAAAFEEVLVVVRPEDDALAEHLTGRCPGARIVRCADARLGMGHSLACGARAARDWDYLFVALADMAWVRPDTLLRLRDLMLQAPADCVIQPWHRKRPGHPVGFAGRYLDALKDLGGDEGARAVVAAAGPDRIRLEVDDPGIFEDLDNPP
jgi:molybdenum cofactor cytidylyltransferase